MVGALRRLIETPQSRGEVFNVGSTDAICVLDLARLVKQQLGSASEIVFVPFEEAYDEDFEEPVDRLPDLSRIHAMIGFEPRTSLAQTINQIVEHGIAI